MAKDGLPAKYKYSVFLSYSTDPDYSLVRKLESFLETFHKLKTPKELLLTPLNICVDGSDFSISKTQKREGTNAVASLIDTYLSQSAELLVLCSNKAKISTWVDQEVRWFLKHRGPDSIRLAVTEGVDPGAEQREVFSQTIIEAGLHQKPWYDLREAKGAPSAGWRKVKNYDDERTRLAADLNGISAGEIQPIWYRQQRRVRRNKTIIASVSSLFILAAAAVAVYWGIVAKKEEGLKYIADAYQVLYRDPAQAVIKAYRGNLLVPGEESETALRAAFKVAVLHYYNRRENARITGSGPSYLAGRWKQGDVFTEDSPDGQFRLLVTERGEDGPNPPGEVYLLNNKTLKTTKLEPCIDRKGRVEDVSFDQASQHVFISRYFNLSVHSTTGKCIGGYRFSRYTKSPIHLVEGYFQEKYVLVSETKGGLWLAIPHESETRYFNIEDAITLQEEFHGDPAMFIAFSQDRNKAASIFESGRCGVLVYDQHQDKPVLFDLVKENVLFAAFYPGNDNQIITSGKDGVIRIWRINGTKAEEINNIQVSNTELDWVTLSEDGHYMLAAGSGQQLYIIDAKQKEVLSVLDYAEDIDWSVARSVSGKNESITIYTDSRKPIVKALDDPDLHVTQLMKVGEEQWLLSSESEMGDTTSGTPYRIESGKISNYPSFPPDLSTIEKVGDYYWLKGSRLYQFVQGGVKALPGKDVVVIDMLHQGKDYWMATNKGLYWLRDEKLTRLSAGKLGIKKIFLIDGRIYMATKRGAYIIEKDLIIRLTDSFLEIKEIKSINGKIWLLTEADSFFEKAGPIYLVEGYFSRRIGNIDSQVTDVFEARGKTWVATLNGFFQYEGSQLKEVSGIKGVVTEMNETGGRLVLSSRTSGIFKHYSGSYELDDMVLVAQPLKTLDRQWRKYGNDYLALKYNIDIINNTPISVVAVRREGDQEIELDLKGAIPSSIKEVDGKAWLLTNEGVFRMVNGQPEKDPGINLPINSILKRDDGIWLLSNKAVIRVNDPEYKIFELDQYTASEFKEVAGDIWILSAGSAGQPGLVFRIRGGQLQKITGPFGSVKDVVLIDDQVWLTTANGKIAGPLYKVLEE